MEYEFCHSGIKGMKWGIRRYQNPDGSLTAAGRAHYGVGKERGKITSKDQKHAMAKAKRVEARQARKAARIAEKNARKEAERKREKDAKELQRYEELRRKPASKLTAAEMQELTARLAAEKQYKDLLRATEEPKLFDGKKFVVDVLQDSGKKILSGVLTYGAGKAVNSLLGEEVFKVGNSNSKKQKTDQDEKEAKEEKPKAEKKPKEEKQPKAEKKPKEEKPKWELVSEPQTQKANNYERAPSEPIDVEWEEVFDSRNVPSSGANTVNRILLTSGSTPLLMLPEPRKRS